MTSSKNIFLLTSFIASCGSCCFGATVLLDSFDTGDFRVAAGSPDFDNVSSSPINSPFAESRSVALRDRRQVLETFTGSVASGSLQVDMFSNQGQLEFFPVFFLKYVGENPTTLLSNQAFSFNFSEVTGNGTIYIQLDTQLTVGSEDILVPISEAGRVIVPVDSFGIAPNSSLSSFQSINIDFEGRTPEFSFTLDEINVIPEPSTALLCFLAVNCLWRRKRFL
jgi:hypothetical protein